MRYIILTIALLGALLTACTGPGTSQPTSTPTTAPPTAVTTVPTTAPTSAPLPSATPNPSPTQAVAPTASSEPTQPAPTPGTVSTLPRDAIWVRNDTVLTMGGNTPPLDLLSTGHTPLPFISQAAPDGSFFAFVEDRPERRGLVLLDMRSGESRFLDIGAVIGVRFSPDSRSLALTTLKEPNWQVQVLDLASGELRLLREGALMAQSPDSLPTVPVPVAWTADGLIAQGIVYATGAPPQNLVLIDLASGELRTLRDSPHLGAFVAPNGRVAALITGRVGIGEAPVNGIVLLDLSSGQETVLVPEAQQLIGAIRLSPDGTQVLYGTSPAGPRVNRIHLINADGSGEQSLGFEGYGIASEYRDIAWQNNETILLLVVDVDGNLRLHAAPAERLHPPLFQTLADYGPVGPGGVQQIVYIPGQ